MDFYQIRVKEAKTGRLELYPDFIVGRSKDLMVRGRAFYAIWDEEAGLWSQNELDVQRLVDGDLHQEAQRLRDNGKQITVKSMRSSETGLWKKYRNLLKEMPDNYKQLDAKVIFANTEVKKTDYASKKLPYAIGEGETPAWEELISTLYLPEERAKIEWAIGSIIAGDSKRIQKFLVFYGAPATGKSTIINIIDKMFEGYSTPFDAKEMGSNNGTFATAAFKDNPLVAFQHDGDLSRLEDNARLNSAIAHEKMTINEKFRPAYKANVDAMIFIGTNQPVKITDAKSGIIRRLIDINPTNVTFEPKVYAKLIGKIDFELGAIAYHCLEVYQEMGKNFYMGYRPLEMMLQTDVFYNFVEAYFDLFKEQNHTTLNQAWTLYKEYCDETGIYRPMQQYKFKAELKNYFEEYEDRGYVDGVQLRKVYSGFSLSKFRSEKKGGVYSLVLEETQSLFDEVMAGQPAQLATPDGNMYKKWSGVKTTLLDIDTSLLHWVKVPPSHIVIDFDLRDLKGEKSLERNLEAASRFPATYAEYSKSGSGIHLHYRYTGDVGELNRTYVDGVEIKVYTGDASLRRQLSRCNGVPISEISSGLPLKEKKEKMLTTKTITSEKGLRDLIERNLRKEIHPGTKPSVDFILKILDDAYESDMRYDVTDMRSRIVAFAINSTHQADASLKAVMQMKFSSEGEVAGEGTVELTDDRLVFYDVEVYSNLFIICWKFQGGKEIVKMINPKAREVEALFKLKLVGFYNRRYDNHIIYAASLGWNNEQLFQLSQKLINGNRGAPFGAAYSLSYADIWDFSSVKQSLKKFEIDLGILHMALDIPWDQPVDPKDWERVIEYCSNDVVATEAVFEARKQDFVARQILAELSGMTVNDTTQNHTARIIFGEDKNPQKKFIYTDLSKDFPGYIFAMGKSSYKGEDPGEGGYVYAEPGMYESVAVLDVISMHPMSTVQMQTFGPYTKNYEDLILARMAIKRGDYTAARKMLNGRLAPYLEDESAAKDLAWALKIIVNIVYGLTSAKFDNPFRDIRNMDNIVAKRGALFMIDLKALIQDMGYSVVHIKTDSVKVPNADKKIIGIIKEFGKKYGYEFEHEATYDKFCLVNDAVYVGKRTLQEDTGCRVEWTVIGAQFAQPYVFKTLFSGEEVVFDDFCESRSVVQGNMYLDLERSDSPDYTKMRFLGRTGRFVPVLEMGGVLYRVKDDKYYAVTGTKGHLWVEAETAFELKDLQIDMSYFDKLKDEAIKQIEKFGSFEEFVN